MPSSSASVDSAVIADANDGWGNDLDDDDTAWDDFDAPAAAPRSGFLL